MGRLCLRPYNPEVGLGPGHIVLDGYPADLPQRGTAPNFRPLSVVAKGLDGSRCHLVGGIGLAPSHIAFDGDPAPSPPKGHSPPPPIFCPCLLWQNGRSSQLLLRAEHLLQLLSPHRSNSGKSYATNRTKARYTLPVFTGRGCSRAVNTAREHGQCVPAIKEIRFFRRSLF